MSEVSLEAMMDAGAHFGHQTRRWNPKMKPYLYGVRSGVHIIDLGQTQLLLRRAVRAVEEVVASGDSILFVGTKNQAQLVVEEAAKRCEMPYVTRRWLGGMLTNFGTITKSVQRYIELETRQEKNDFEGYTKKERLEFSRQIKKYQVTIGGVKAMKRVPGILFVVDPELERIAVHEANILGIPVIAIVDSNCNPDPVDYLIPANDDALRSVRVFVDAIADACLRGIQKRDEVALGATGKDRKKGIRVNEGVHAFVEKASDFGEKVDSLSVKVDVEETTPIE